MLRLPVVATLPRDPKTAAVFAHGDQVRKLSSTGLVRHLRAAQGRHPGRIESQPGRTSRRERGNAMNPHLTSETSTTETGTNGASAHPSALPLFADAPAPTDQRRGRVRGFFHLAGTPTRDCL